MFNIKLIQLSICAVIFGSIYTIFRKYQSCAILSDPQKSFNQPLIQSFFIFVGMSSIGILKPFLQEKQNNKTQNIKLSIKQQQQTSIPNGKMSKNAFILIIPSLLDLSGTIVDTAGLYYTSVSVSQMLKGSVIFFTYLITLFYLGKKLSLKKHFLMFIILASLFIIGSCNIDNHDIRYQSNPLLGNLLIVLSQLLFSFMFIAEEKLLKNHKIQVIDAVTWQGIWGTLFSLILLIFFSHAQTIVKCDFMQSCSLIYDNPNLLLAILFTFLAIGPFNYFGMSITKESSALHRCLVCTFRMVVVWIVSLISGWQQFSFLQLIGYTILTIAIYNFNENNNQENNQSLCKNQINKGRFKKLHEKNQDKVRQNQIKINEEFEQEKLIKIVNNPQNLQGKQTRQFQELQVIH